MRKPGLLPGERINVKLTTGNSFSLAMAETIAVRQAALNI